MSKPKEWWINPFEDYRSDHLLTDQEYHEFDDSEFDRRKNKEWLLVREISPLYDEAVRGLVELISDMVADLQKLAVDWPDMDLSMHGEYQKAVANLEAYKAATRDENETK